MRSNVRQLYEMSISSSRLVIGLMSGTSFDGLDIALCKIEGHGLATSIQILQFETVAYTFAFKEDLKQVFAKRYTSLERVTLLNETIGHYFADLILKCLKKWQVDPKTVDLIASHGQTIYHAPRRLHKLDYPNGTLQIGDGDHIAVKTGIITISDFRQKHLAAGGEGAPLAVYGDYLLFSSTAEDRIMLNIGGIANFTWLPSSRNPADVFSTDVGPGNTLMDQYIQKNVAGRYYDKDAAFAKSGQLNAALLAELLKSPFITAAFPKTTGPELFNLAYLEKARQASGTSTLAPQHVMATLCHFSAHVIADAIKQCSLLTNPVVYVSGGGMHNPLLMDLLKQHLPGLRFEDTALLGINPDAKEAVLFAVLANETVAGDNQDFGHRHGTPAITMGKISFPN